jgi:outer membrane protein assembly factor BamB
MGALQAWDPVRQQQVWEIPTDGPWDAGILTTASNLLFQGKANGHLRAFNALTGEQLWDENLGLGISAPPITYSVNGKQFLAILVGWGGVMSATWWPGNSRLWLGLWRTNKAPVCILTRWYPCRTVVYASSCTDTIGHF